MKPSEKQVAIVVGVVCLTTFTVLLVTHFISAALYAALSVVTMVVGVAIALLPRIQELSVKVGEARLVLAEIKQRTAELAQMYGGIDHLKRDPMVFDKNKMSLLGLNPHHLPSTTGPMWYTAGVIKRERERLACIMVAEKPPEKIAEAILDSSLDMLVFKYDGPEVSLDIPPKSAEQRRIERGSAF